MNKIKRYIAITLLLIGIINTSAYATDIGSLTTVPAHLTGVEQEDSDIYSIIPRVPGGTGGLTSGIRYEKIGNPENPSEEMVSEISFQVVSKHDYIIGRPTWRTTRIDIMLDILNPN